MPIIIRCPGCQKSLRVRDDLAGSRVQCPSCKQRLVVPEPEEPEELVEEVPEEEPRPARRSRRDPEDEESPRPRSRSRRDEEEEEEERPRRSRPRKRRPPEEEYSVPMGPLLLGIFSILICCIPIVGAYLGYLARNRADEEMMRIPDGRRYRGASKQMEVAKILGTIGVGLSFFMVVLVIVLRFTTR